MEILEDGSRVVIFVGKDILADNVVVCASRNSRRAGLTGRSAIKANEGILMVMPVGRGKFGWQSAIHMFHMRFTIVAIWLDENCKVVDLIEVRPGRIYGPPLPAKYILEAHPDLLGRVVVGDVVRWQKSV